MRVMNLCAIRLNYKKIDNFGVSGGEFKHISATYRSPFTSPPANRMLSTSYVCCRRLLLGAPLY